MPAPRRFPAPWSVEEQAACFTVRDHNGHALVQTVPYAFRVLGNFVFNSHRGSRNVPRGARRCRPRSNAMEMIVKLDSNGAVLVRHSS